MNKIWVDYYTKEGTTGFIISNEQVMEIVITKVEDISYHGSSCYMANYKWISFPINISEQIAYYYETEEDALTELLEELKKKRDRKKIERAKLKEELQELKLRIKTMEFGK